MQSLAGGGVGPSSMQKAFNVLSPVPLVLGYGMFSIMFPITAIPIIATLAWSQIKAYKLGLVHTANPYEETKIRQEVAHTPVINRLYVVTTEIDLIGLLLFTAGWTCLLLPLTLAKYMVATCTLGSDIQADARLTLSTGSLPWSNYKIIVMLTLGPIILIGLAVYEGMFAHFPFIPSRFLKNRTVLAAALIGFFDFISFYLQYTYQYSFIGTPSNAP